jgi:hypothetical protein
MTSPYNVQITRIFNVGDLVKRPLKTDIYKIESLREEPGGSFHDGYNTTTIATLRNINTNEEEHDIVIRYDNYMCRIVYDWAIHTQ